MSTRDLAYHLLQETYYDSVDRGDMAAAVLALHEEVEWSHAQVWAHHGFAQGKPTRMQGRGVVGAFLAERVQQLKEAGIRHRVRELVCDGDRGAMLGYVLGPDGSEQPFMVWFELRDERISRYVLRPI